MANNQFDRQVINLRERPLSSDINYLQSQIDRSLRELVLQVWKAKSSGGSELAGNPISGFIGDGLKVRASSPAGLSVTVAAGLGFLDSAGGAQVSAVGGVTGLDDLSRYKPLPLLADATINGVPAGPGAGNTRTDIVEVRMNRVLGNPLSRDTLDTLTGLFVSGNVNKTLAFTLDNSVGVVTDPAASTAAISYKVGLVNGAEPAVTAGYVKLATIFTENGDMVGTVTRANIIDKRLLLAPYGMVPFSASFAVPSGAAAPPTSVLLNAPPGMEMVVSKHAAPLNSRFRVYLIGGNLAAARGNMQGSILRAFASGEFVSLNYGGTSFGTVDATVKAALANANISGPALSVPVGTSYMMTEFYGSRQAGATTDNAIPDPALVDIQGFVQRY